VRAQHLLRIRRAERVGADEPFNGRRWVEHWIEDHQVEGAGFADLEADDGERVALVLEVDGRFGGHVDLLVEVEEVFAAEIGADG
jgi:hypothetical protein